MMQTALHLFILITGISGLIYQVAWQKYLTRLLGADSISTAIILGTFLGGLSAGYYICGKLTMATRNQFRTYAILEGVVGLWGLGFPLTFHLVEKATCSWSFSYPVPIIFQGLLCSIMLIGIPTICMGGTIPVLTKGLSQNLEESTRTHAGIYAVNTAGAFVGALAAGFFLVPKIGLPGSVLAAAVLNLSASAFFFTFAQNFAPDNTVTGKSADGICQKKDTALPDRRTKISPGILYTIAFLSGFYVMTLENSLIRVTNLSFGSSSYSFSIIVSAFILLIAIGSFTVSRLKTISNNLLWINQVVITASLLAVYASIDSWPYWAHVIRVSCQSNIAGMASYYVKVFVFISLILLVPVFSIGATLPIVFNAIKKDMDTIGRHSGNVFSLNTLGSLAGCLFGGIILYGFLDIREIFLIAVFMAAVSAWLAARSMPRPVFHFSSAIPAVIAILLFTAPWYNKANFKLGTFRETTPMPYSFEGPKHFFKKFLSKKDLKLYDDDPVGTVSILEFDIQNRGRKTTGPRALNVVVNGKSDSATFEPTVKMLAHIPALLSRKKENTLVIGLGTGITAGELALYNEVRSIEVAEISPSIIKALPLFEKHNAQVHKNAKLKIFQGDAFNILKGTQKKYDIIISEPSNPWVTGVDSLFTKEFYGIVKNHLNEEGLFVQWLHFYESSELMLGIVTRTLSESFNFCRAFVVGQDADLILVCSQTDMSLENIHSAEEILRNNARVSKSLKKIGIPSVDQLLIREIWSPAFISNNFSGYPLQILDKPILHYVAGRDFFMDRKAPTEFIFDQKTANFSNDFLMSQKYPDWGNFKLQSSVIHDLIRISGSAHYLQTAIKHLTLRAYLNNPSDSSIPAGLARDPVLRILPLITGKSRNRHFWSTTGLQSAPFRIKAEKLFEIVARTRNWIVPYSLDGLKRILMNGIRTEKNTYERNWIILQYCRILLEEQADLNRVKAVLDMAHKTNTGDIPVSPEDTELLEKILQEVKKRPF
ncbi:hypothetical protein ACFL43_01345 [Thermodesulfobacteriota bacterium]